LGILAIKARSEFEVLASRHAFIEILVFGHYPDEWFQTLLFSDDVATRDAATSGGRPQLSAQHSNGGGFTGSVVAQESEDFTRVY
jgi:hypothetical protein